MGIFLCSSRRSLRGPQKNKNNDSLHELMRTTTYKLKHKTSPNSLSRRSKLVKLMVLGKTTVLKFVRTVLDLFWQQVPSTMAGPR